MGGFRTRRRALLPEALYAPDDTVTAVSIFNKVEEAEESTSACLPGSRQISRR
jgi:hypothetical protein